MKIAIIGSGYFGSTIALILSKKHNIDLYEKENYYYYSS
jgi:predicted NAD/FAD-binding protein